MKYLQREFDHKEKCHDLTDRNDMLIRERYLELFRNIKNQNNSSNVNTINSPKSNVFID